MKYSLFIIVFLWVFTIKAQTNIIPNPGFEDFLDVPDDWYHNGKHFTEIVRYWHSPTPASPDAYGPGIKIPDHWRERGFGDIKAFDGDRMVGITTFGCEKGKPHCREYIQIRLSEALVAGQDYTISFSVSHLPKSAYTNNLGVYFSVEEIVSEMDGLLKAIPQLKLREIVEPPDKEWIRISANITPKEAYEWITIGNFHGDSETENKKRHFRDFDYAYYYIDAFELIKKEPILPVPEGENKFTDLQIKTGDTLSLENIYFDYDRADFLQRSFEQLSYLFRFLQDNSNLSIEIHGHTDNTGDYAYNQFLSEQRARAVVNYLIQNGIPKRRLSFKGFGSTRPLDTNQTYDGRKRNRRVEFLVLHH